MRSNNTTDEELMRQICLGNRQAFEMLYQRYFYKLIGFSLQFTGDRQIAEDVVQEVFMKVIDQPERFEDGRRFSTWIYTLAANASKNQKRMADNRKRLIEENVRPFETRSETMKHDMDYRYLKQKLRTVLQEMSDKEQQIYSMRFEHELSLKEIAEIMQIPEGSVRSGLFYLLKKMSKELQELKSI